MLTFTFLEITVILTGRVQSPCQLKFFDLSTKSSLSQAISYTFLDKHFLLIENMSSEASSSESFILLLFFRRSQNPFFQKSHFFKKSAPFSPLFSPILSTTRFCFAPFHASFTIKSLSNSLYFSHQILHSFTQFIET